MNFLSKVGESFVLSWARKQVMPKIINLVASRSVEQNTSLLFLVIAPFREYECLGSKMFLKKIYVSAEI